MKQRLFAALTFYSACSVAQDYRWQQKADYTMAVRLDAATHLLTGDQKILYHNNSPDTLRKIYYNLFFNAFQPGSMMDVRSRTIADPDRRIGNRIAALDESEIGYQRVLSLKKDGKEASFKVIGTLLEVTPGKPVLPRSKSTFEMKFEAQVPVQIRRSGRNNLEGIAYSMTQWYPKIAEYDFQGWHAYQYVAREFHGVWGDFDVTITMDSSFTVAGTGTLQDPDRVGHGYQREGVDVKRKEKEISWRFVARNVIDFAWAADPDYTHDRIKVPDGPEIHFFYQKTGRTGPNWKALQPIAAEVFEFLNRTFGKYPFETYSVIQGGDGAMEYPMCTLILGDGKLDGLAISMAHEVAHSWFHMTLASNESLHAWMDEGFSDFASDEALAHITKTENDHSASYKSYFTSVSNGLYELPSQHSDHFTTNRGYRSGSYVAGAVFLHQLKYIIGNEPFYEGMLKYYNTWKFRHPEPNDLMRVMEKTSGMELHWYLRYWINTTKKIDYGVNQVTASNGSVDIVLQRIGEIPMPIDLLVTYKDGTRELVYIPMSEMLGSKPVEDPALPRRELKPWAWVSPAYAFKIDRLGSEIESLEIDPSQRMADVNRANNKINVTEGLNTPGEPGNR